MEMWQNSLITNILQRLRMSAYAYALVKTRLKKNIVGFFLKKASVVD